jgi:type VI secretion system secreted protein Hcp
MKLDGDSRVEYLKVDLTDIIVSDFRWTGSGNGELMGEQVSLNFAEFKTAYKLQQNQGSAGGNTDFGYNIQTSKAT